MTSHAKQYPNDYNLQIYNTTLHELLPAKLNARAHRQKKIESDKYYTVFLKKNGGSSLQI
jgi:hypothetical protein